MKRLISRHSLVADADAAVVEPRAAAVFADGGCEAVDVVVCVAYGDPAAGQVVAVGAMPAVRTMRWAISARSVLER